jgi:glutathione S-transferase
MISQFMSRADESGRTLFISAFFNDDRDTMYSKHCKDKRPTFLQGLEKQLNSHDASLSDPYVVGNAITYEDLVLFQICHDENLIQDDRAGSKGYPRLVKLIDAVDSRPKIKAFMESSRYQG